MWYNLEMKRRVQLLAFLLVLIFVLSACNGQKGEMSNYFNNFISNGNVMKAEKLLTLSDNVTFFSRDENTGIFITKEKILADDKEQYVTLYGFADSSAELIKPLYWSVIDIVGDYAIAVRSVGADSSIKLRIGVVKIRGINKGREYGFNYEYAKASRQYQFVGDSHVAIVGGLSVGNSNYDYSVLFEMTEENGILEVGRVNANTLSTIQLYDDNLVVINKNEVKYYNIRTIDEYGSFKILDSYVPFNESEYPMASYPAKNIEISHYYIGNNWFIRTASYTTDSEYSGYHFIREASDGTLYYIIAFSDRYHVPSKNSSIMEKVAFVVNKYNINDYRNIADAINDEEDFIVEEGIVKEVYRSPSIPVGNLIKEEYSLVYYYFFPIDNSNLAKMTFALYDQSASGINLSSLIYPLLFVDDIGILCNDPNLEVHLGDLAIYDYSGKKKIFAFADDRTTYDLEYAFGGYVVATRYLDKVSATGAFDYNGNNVIPFKYYELTPFVGDYATASYVDGVNNIRTFVRIGRNGDETKLDNVTAIKNGVYVTLAPELKKYRLHNNAGQVLIEPTEEIYILDAFCVEGNKYFSSIAMCVEGNHGVLYGLV